jgi:tetratricopeptide (TPR) repeat protein
MTLKRPALSLVFLMAVVLAAATGLDYPDLIRKTKRYLTVFPDDNAERLNLAWYYMESGQPDSSLIYYDEAAARNPVITQAISGSLWALNELSCYSETIARSDSLILKYGDNPDILNHRALAYLRTGFPLQARKAYTRSMKRSDPDNQSYGIALDGLAWSYLSENDHARAGSMAKILPYAYDEALMKSLERLKPTFAVGAGYKDNGDLYFLAESYLRKKTLLLYLGAEEYYYAGTHYRTAFKLAADKQASHFGLRLAGQYLRGTDSDIYPVWQGSLSARGNIYISRYRLVPLASILYTYTPEFSMEQADLGLAAGSDMISLQVIHSWLYQDNTASSADQQGRVISASASLRVYHDFTLSLSYTHGALEWWSSPNGSLMDTNSANDDNLGLGLWLPISKRVGFSLYGQLGRNDEDINFLTQGMLFLYL